MNLVYLNGSYLPPEQARVSVADRGLAYGDGVFTTIRVSESEPLLLEWHLERLGRDAAAIHFQAPSQKELADACAGLVSRLELKEGVIKAIVTRGTGSRGPSTKNAGEPTVVVSASRMPELRPALRAITVPDGRDALAAHKTLNYLPNVLALRRAEESGGNEAIFTRDGMLLEGTASNLVGLSDGERRTPPLDGGVLPGITRRALLETGAVREGNLPVDDTGPLYCANSVRGVEAIAELDGHPLLQDPSLHAALEKALESCIHPARPE